MGKEKLKNKKGVLLLTNKLGKFERLNLEEMKMLVNGTVQGLAPVAVIEKRKKLILQVEAVNWVPLTAYMNSSMDAETALAFIWNTARIADDCERHGLRVDGLRWDPSRVFVDQEGNIHMVYWPVTTLEQFESNPLTFYYSFWEILNNSGIDSDIASRYYYYFYQRDYFDFRMFYQMMAEILEQWRTKKYKIERERDRQNEINMRKPDRQNVISSGWLEQPGSQKRINLTLEETYVGRDPVQCNVAIEGFDGVSRRHAVIHNKENQYFVTDLNSSNGTYLQGQRLKPQQRMALSDGMTIRFGNATYIFHKTNLNQTISIHQVQRR